MGNMCNSYCCDGHQHCRPDTPAYEYRAVRSLMSARSNNLAAGQRSSRNEVLLRHGHHLLSD